MFGIIFGTICLIALIATIRRERYFRRHGYPEHERGYYGCGGYHHHRWHPGMPPHEPPPDPTATPAKEGSAS